MAGRGFEHLDHTADWAVRIHGADLPDLLRQAAAALLTLANPEPRPHAPATRAEISVQATDRETLLVRWLEEVHYLLESHGQIPQHITLTLSPGLHLIASLDLVPVAYSGRPIKAITYHDLQVVEAANGLQATVVFDV